MKKSVKIFMNGKFLETASSREAAESRINRYMREDRYEVEVEHYAIPVNGYPVYTIE